MKPDSPPNLLGSSEARRTVVVYVAVILLIVGGGLYGLWRIRLLSNYLVANRVYVLDRDERWERHIKVQAELSREILRRLPK